MNKQLVSLALIAALAIGGGGWLMQQQQTSLPESQALFANGLDKAAQINRIRIENAQGVLLQAELVDANWVAEFSDFSASFPLDKTKLSDFLNTLVQARMVEAKTSKAANYHHLGVDDISDQDSLANLITLGYQADTSSWQVLVGHQVATGKGTYVRLPKAAQSWQVDQSIALPGDEFAWLQRPILPFNTEDIVRLSRLDGTGWQINRDGEQFSLKNMPKGRELRYPGILSAMLDSMLAVDFDELRLLDDPLWQQAQPVAEFRLTTADERQVRASLTSVEEQYYLKFSSTQFDAYWLNWSYAISNYSAQQLLKNQEDLLAEAVPVTTVKSAKADIDEGDSGN